jgi:hypothetical protein
MKDSKIYNFSVIVLNFIVIAMFFYIYPVLYSLPNELFIRLGFYFIQFLPAALSIIIYSTGEKNVKSLLLIFFISIVFIYYVYTLYVNGLTYKLIPYKFFFLENE